MFFRIHLRAHQRQWRLLECISISCRFGQIWSKCNYSILSTRPLSANPRNASTGFIFHTSLPPPSSSCLDTPTNFQLVIDTRTQTVDFILKEKRSSSFFQVTLPRKKIQLIMKFVSYQLRTLHISSPYTQANNKRNTTNRKILSIFKQQKA